MLSCGVELGWFYERLLATNTYMTRRTGMNFGSNKSIELLGGTPEALVLGYHLHRTDGRFVLVCEAWEKLHGADRSFLKFVFAGVSAFKRTQGRIDWLAFVESTFVARATPGSWVIQDVRIARSEDERHSVIISLGVGFGSVGFQFSVVSHERSDLVARENGHNSWDYFDCDSNREVDFYNPFGCRWAEAPGAR